ncbi:MAG TPA: amidohydrolase family protein [Candidatus Competibacter sp.]|nr:amidohydrolase family protein [Candidatus Competibacter sp.]
MRTCITTLIALVLNMGLSPVAHAQQYDLVINNGRVMDPETMYDDVANVGVNGDRIATITKAPIAGKQSIDATGLVVAPGFIDTHYHAIDEFATKLAVADGITTGMDLEAGASRVADWYAQKAQVGWQINYGTTSSLGFNRLYVHDPELKLDKPVDATTGFYWGGKAGEDGTPGWSVSRSNVEQMNKLMTLIDEDLRQGAIGLGAPVAYMQRGVTSYELFEAQRAAARYGRLTSVHTRFHLNSQTPTEAPIGLDEVLANAMVLRAPLLLAHDNDYGWWENEEKLKLAREQGYNVWAEYYPWAAGSTLISADFLRPDLWEKVNGYKYEETVYDPGLDKFLTKDEFVKAVKETPSRTIVVHLPPRTKWMKYWLTVPHMVVASDAMAGLGKDGKLLPWSAPPTAYAGHPRTASSYSVTLQMGRERGVPLMFTLSQISYWTAKHLGDTGLEAMKERGRVQVGKVADLTLFDPKTVAARATYKDGENGLPPVGIQYVIVNGTVVVKQGTVLPVRPGQPIRFPVETKGRFQPVDVDKWLGEQTISVPDLHQLDDTGAGEIEKH